MSVLLDYLIFGTEKDTKKIPAISDRDEYQDFIKMLDKLTDEQKLLTKTFMTAFIQENQAAEVETAKQITNGAS